MNDTYQKEAYRLTDAIDIASRAFSSNPPENFTQEVVNTFLDMLEDERNEALHPDPKYRTIESLNYLVESVLSYFQENDNPTTDYFWESVQRQNLGYERRNLLSKILVRGKFKNNDEVNYIESDVLQNKTKEAITDIEADKLRKMIADYKKG